MQLGEQGRSWPGHVDGAGRILIPAESRHSLGWGNGTEVVIESDGDSLRILTLGQFTREVQELFGQSSAGEELWSDELIAERRAEARREAGDDA